ncbi:hypothetical protein NC652_041649 [Populus alba x Populus x berolinensis]|nr:hypothetical protein NC652_041649 [Populus alba x Populus x berolinensis]
MAKELPWWGGNENSNSDDNIACSDDDKILMYWLSFPTPFSVATRARQGIFQTLCIHAYKADSASWIKTKFPESMSFNLRVKENEDDVEFSFFLSHPSSENVTAQPCITSSIVT